MNQSGRFASLAMYIYYRSPIYSLATAHIRLSFLPFLSSLTQINIHSILWPIPISSCSLPTVRTLMRPIPMNPLIIFNYTTYHGHHVILSSWFRHAPLHNPNLLFRQPIELINQLVDFGFEGSGVSGGGLFFDC